jgi:hypothetical protein
VSAVLELGVERISTRHHREQTRTRSKQQQAYEGLNAARHAQGVARIVMGLHLATLQDTEGWRGRTGAKSFRRFLMEEGIEPKAAYMYMAVARVFLLDHAVSPDRIAMVSMRVLVFASRYLHLEDEAAGTEANTDDVVSIVTSMPSAEAVQALQERFEMNAEAIEQAAKPRFSKPVANILSIVDGLTHEGRAELYQALRFTAPQAPGARAAAR